MNRGVLALAAVLAAAPLRAIELKADRSLGPVAFAAAEIEHAASMHDEPGLRIAITVASDPALGSQAYRLERPSNREWRVVGGDAAGAMYGGLDLAEAIRNGRLDELSPGPHSPHIANRGLKFNLPLDLRTPSYSDCSDAFQANIPEVWSIDFWHAFLDEMARDRFNVLSLWSLHPFPSLVQVPEFPDVALDDVWRTRVKLDDHFAGTGVDMVKPSMLADHEVVKRLPIAAKIAFSRDVMAYARERGISVYVFTWNIFAWGAIGHYGITDSADNPVTIAYTRASVRELVKTYPLLAGIGITAGEHMPARGGDEAKERWLWQTYGEGVREALKDDPHRQVRLIHRFHWSSQSTILQAFHDYPGPLDFSFKYSVAHMYSITAPPFIAPVLEHLAPGRRTWLTLRNDDIYSFRFGDPDYTRDYLLHLPPADKLGGFYMGSDGYCWGREFLDREPGTGPRQLVLEKQWYSFMLWGRLAYDPSLPDLHFERALAARFPEVANPHALYRALQSAAQTMPLITRFFWGDIDEKWFPEACLSKPNVHGFYTVADFVNGSSMPGAGVLDIRTWCARLAGSQPMNGTTPLEIADALQGAAAEAFTTVSAIRGRSPADFELRRTLDDCEALAWLARYYAAKIRAACALARFDTQRDIGEREAAVRFLDNALSHWKRYAAIRDGCYVPALYNRVGYVDITKLTASVAADVELARNWVPGTHSGNRKNATEKGFRP